MSEEEDLGGDDFVFTFEGEKFCRSDVEAIIEVAVSWNLLSDWALANSLNFRKKKIRQGEFSTSDFNCVDSFIQTI